ARENQVLGERRAHYAPFLQHVAATAAARRDAAGRSDESAAGVEDEHVAALQLVDVEMDEALIALFGEIELIVGLRRRRADMPHRERRVLEERVGGAAL